VIRFSFLSLFTRRLTILAVIAGLLVFSIPTHGQNVRPPDNAPTSRQHIEVPSPNAELWRPIRNREDADDPDPAVRTPPPRALIQNLWLEVQSGQADIAGTSQVKGVDSAVLINTQGEQWRNFRMEQLPPVGMWLLSVALIGMAVFFAIRGQIKISEGRSGLKIMRFTLTQRTIHWTVAITFVILGITGLILLYGRMALIPVLGANAFSVIALVAKRLHDFIGPVFGIALILQFILFIRGNLPHIRDLKWIAKGGGLFGGHVSSHRYNAGEKGWFWIAMLGGSVVVVTGLILDFPIFDQSRQTMAFTHVLHSLSALAVLTASLGHIYMGTIGTQGTFEIMRTGYCDANWAKEHHDLWYEEMKAEGNVGEVPEKAQQTSAPGAVQNA